MQRQSNRGKIANVIQVLNKLVQSQETTDSISYPVEKIGPKPFPHIGPVFNSALEPSSRIRWLLVCCSELSSGKSHSAELAITMKYNLL